jgi:hypothetical protein
MKSKRLGGSRLCPVTSPRLGLDYYSVGVQAHRVSGEIRVPKTGHRGLFFTNGVWMAAVIAAWCALMMSCALGLGVLLIVSFHPLGVPLVGSSNDLDQVKDFCGMCLFFVERCIQSGGRRGVSFGLLHDHVCIYLLQ